MAVLGGYVETFLYVISVASTAVEGASIQTMLVNCFEA